MLQMRGDDEIGCGDIDQVILVPEIDGVPDPGDEIIQIQIREVGEKMYDPVQFGFGGVNILHQWLYLRILLLSNCNLNFLHWMDLPLASVEQVIIALRSS